MIKSGELETVMAMFEKSSKQLPVYLGGSLERESKEVWPKQRYYAHGKVNEIFTVYLWGYSFGRCAERTS